MYGCVCGNKWLHWERIGVIPCADADAVCSADTDTADLIGPSYNSKRIRTRLRQEIPRVTSLRTRFPKFLNGGKVLLGR